MLDKAENHHLYRDSIASIYRRTEVQNHFLALADFVNEKLKYSQNLNTSRSDSYRISIDYIRENVSLYNSIQNNPLSYFHTLDINEITIEKVSFYMLQSCRQQDRDRVTRHSIQSTLKLFVGYLVFQLIDELYPTNLIDRQRIPWR